jgi:hypothetical protein
MLTVNLGEKSDVLMAVNKKTVTFRDMMLT